MTRWLAAVLVSWCELVAAIVAWCALTLLFLLILAHWFSV